KTQSFSSSRPSLLSRFLLFSVKVDNNILMKLYHSPSNNEMNSLYDSELGHILDTSRHIEDLTQHLFDYLNIWRTKLNIFSIISTSGEQNSTFFRLSQHLRILTQHFFDYLYILR